MSQDEGISLASGGRRGAGDEDGDSFESALWARLAHATDLHGFAAGWLEIQCRAFDGAVRGIVVLRTSETAPFSPIAIWPEGIEGSPRLAAVVERALTQRRSRSTV